MVSGKTSNCSRHMCFGSAVILAEIACEPMLHFKAGVLAPNTASDGKEAEIK